MASLSIMIPDSKILSTRRSACKFYEHTVLVYANYSSRELPTGSASYRKVFQDFNALGCMDLQICEHRLNNTICEPLTTLLDFSFGRPGRGSPPVLAANKVTSSSSPMDINALSPLLRRQIDPTFQSEHHRVCR
jgi:hypothetical protein